MVRAEALTMYGGEQWVINKAIHYNEWVSVTKQEFRAVVEAFKSLLLQFRCPKADCESWAPCDAEEGKPGEPALPLHGDQSESQHPIGKRLRYGEYQLNRSLVRSERLSV